MHITFSSKQLFPTKNSYSTTDDQGGKQIVPHQDGVKTLIDTDVLPMCLLPLSQLCDIKTQQNKQQYLMMCENVTKQATIHDDH